MYIDAIDKVLERLDDVFTPQQKIEKIIWLITYIYCCLQKFAQENFREQYRSDIEKKLAEFAMKWDRSNLTLSAEYMPYVSEIVRAQSDGAFLPNEGFAPFVTRIIRDNSAEN